MVWTSDRFARNDDGKAVGLETVTTVLDDVSNDDMSIPGPQSSVYRRAHTSASRAADFAGEDRFVRALVFLLPCARIQQVAAVKAEDEGADSRHCSDLSS
jgi:hypothetical protein